MTVHQTTRIGDDQLRTDLSRAAELVREVPDFPEPGVLFRDIGPVLADGSAFATVVSALAEGYAFDVVAGVEARGFLLGAAVARAFGTGVIGLRKPGKLPAVADRVEYTLEYGSAALELPAATLGAGQRVLVVDDVLATGGTIGAACSLVRNSGAEVVGTSVVLELTALKGRERVPDEDVRALFSV